MTALRDLYPMPGIDPHWHVPNEFDSVFDWRFDEGRTTLMHLYQKGKDMQWDAVDRIDWELDLDPENPMEMPDEAVSIYGSDIWNKMNKAERIELRQALIRAQRRLRARQAAAQREKLRDEPADCCKRVCESVAPVRLREQHRELCTPRIVQAVERAPIRAHAQAHGPVSAQPRGFGRLG